MIACLFFAYYLPHLSGWVIAGPWLLFLGLLTLLNAPFDWISLGLTRGLLRRGLEVGGWAPLGLALLDALLAAVIVGALTFTMVLGVQLFDALAVAGGGQDKAVLPLTTLFDGIQAHPTAPEYWWVYALLLSTMIPSILNLAIGGASLARGLPWMSSWVLRSMPAGGKVLDFDRVWIALVIALQVVGGAILGAFVQFAVLGGLFVYALPSVGLELLQMARDLEAANLPGLILPLIIGQ